MKADISVQNHGSIVLLVPGSPAGQSWLEDHIGADNGYQPYWPTVVVEPRYVGNIIEGARAEGLAVS